MPKQAGRFLLFSLSILVSLKAFPVSAESALRAGTAWAGRLSSSVIVLGGERDGSGTVLKNRRLVLTSAHILGSRKSGVRVYVPICKESYAAEQIWTGTENTEKNPERDFAVLRLKQATCSSVRGAEPTSQVPTIGSMFYLVQWLSYSPTLKNTLVAAGLDLPWGADEMVYGSGHLGLVSEGGMMASSRESTKAGVIYYDARTFLGASGAGLLHVDIDSPQIFAIHESEITTGRGRHRRAVWILDEVMALIQQASRGL